MIRLYRCPPELAGDFPADFVASPLVRWSRHRDLLEASAKLRPFRPRRHRAREAFIWIGAWLGVAGMAELAALLALNKSSNSALAAAFQNIPFGAALGLVWQSFALAAVGSVAFFVEIAPQWNPFGKSRAFQRRGGWGLSARGGLNPAHADPQVREALMDLWMAGVGFRGAVALSMGRSALLTRGEVLRARREWPLLGGLALGGLPAEGPADAILATLGWFVILRTVILPFRAGLGDGCGLVMTNSLFRPFSMREGAALFGRMFRDSLDLWLWALAAWLACFAACRREALGPGSMDYFASLLAAAWALTALAKRKRLETIALGAYPHGPRDLVRRGEAAFAEWVHRHAE